MPKKTIKVSFTEEEIKKELADRLGIFKDTAKIYVTSEQPDSDGVPVITITIEGEPY